MVVDMTTAESTIERLIYTDLIANNNKYWDIEQTGTTVVTRWGRVGATTGQQKSFSFASEADASKFFEKKIKEKMKKGYTKQRTVATSGESAHVASAQVKIEHAGDSETTQLIDFLVKRNIHKIEGLTSVRMEAGRLTTPLGPVTAEGLDEAELLLGQMAATADNSRLADLANQYLRIVPRNIGMRRVDPAALFGTTSLLAKEQATLDSLRAVVNDLADRAKQTTSDDADAAVFETSLEHIASNDAEFKRINKLFLDSQNRRHSSAGMRLRRAWRMTIKAQADAFESDLKPVWELWHGTKDVNLLSILKNGFIIPKRSSGIQVTGRMYGDGVYFSDQSTKSLNYAGGYWSGQASQRPFMLLSDVAMGKQYMAQRGLSGDCPRGYDSVFAKAGTAVLNNEMVVFRLSQIRSKFLCEFGN